MGDMEADIRTHHIHIVKWNGTEWKNYIHFRDYLNANENVALQYEKLKEELESKYADDRVAYTKGKQNMINKISRKWKRSDLWCTEVDFWHSQAAVGRVSRPTVRCQEKSWHLFYRIGNFVSIRQKSSARMRTRRKGRWLPRQPRLGARMCQGTFFFMRRNRISCE